MKITFAKYSFIMMLNSCCGFINTGIIQGFFQEKLVKYANVFTCGNKADQVNIFKALNSHNRMVLVANISTVNILNVVLDKYKRIAVVIDGDCETTHDFFKKCGKRRCFSDKHNWLVLSSSKNYSKLFENVSMDIDADINVAYPDRNVGYVIDDVYNPSVKRGGTLKISRLGYYNQLNGYKARETRNKYVVRRNLTGVTFKAVIVLPEAYEGTLENYLKSDERKEINTFNRFHSRIMHYCKDYYNFSMDITEDSSWGYLLPDGTMDGLVGKLQRRKIDFGLSPLFVKQKRGEVIQYGRRTWKLKSAFLFRNPRTRNSIEIFVKPLSISVWILIVVLAVLSIIMLKLSLTHEIYEKYVDSSWSYTTICTIGAFCQQGTTSTPNLICGRITLFWTFLLSIMTYQFYSASLVSFLLTDPSTVITSLSELLTSHLRAGCEDILYNKDYFHYTTDNVSRRLYEKWSGKGHHTDFFLKPRDGLSMVEQGGYAFHVELATAYPIITRRFGEGAVCGLRQVPMFGVKAMHANYQKRSPFRDMIDICLHRFAENGVIDREIKFWHPRKPECALNAKSTIINTGMEDFYPAIMILGIGIVASLNILVLEIYYSSKTVEKQEKAMKRVAVFPFTH